LASTDFNAWITPVGIEGFYEAARRFLLSIFTRGLARHQRWGFKEIRYHRPEVVTFLQRTFPQAQFVVLHRDPVEVCTSHILTPWSPDLLPHDDSTKAEETLGRIIESRLYTILGERQNQIHGLRAAGAEWLALDYERLVEDAEAQMRSTFSFLRLRTDERHVERMKVVIGARAGETPRERTFGAAILTRTEIRGMVEKMIPGVMNELASNGVDNSRIQRM
jgi:hypothetical protein